jgi:hypothetical protein
VDNHPTLHIELDGASSPKALSTYQYMRAKTKTHFGWCLFALLFAMLLPSSFRVHMGLGEDAVWSLAAVFFFAIAISIKVNAIGLMKREHAIWSSKLEEVRSCNGSTVAFDGDSDINPNSIKEARKSMKGAFYVLCLSFVAYVISLSQNGNNNTVTFMLLLMLFALLKIEKNESLASKNIKKMLSN